MLVLTTCLPLGEPFLTHIGWSQHAWHLVRNPHPRGPPASATTGMFSPMACFWVFLHMFPGWQYHANTSSSHSSLSLIAAHPEQIRDLAVRRAYHMHAMLMHAMLLHICCNTASTASNFQALAFQSHFCLPPPSHECICMLWQSMLGSIFMYSASLTGDIELDSVDGLASTESASANQGYNYLVTWCSSPMLKPGQCWRGCARRCNALLPATCRTSAGAAQLSREPQSQR